VVDDDYNKVQKPLSGAKYQMAGVLLYTYPQVVQVVWPNGTAGGAMITSFHHTRSDFKVFWNVSNDIDFLIRDYDRKVKPIGQEIYEIIITSAKTGTVLLRSDLSVVNPSTGHVRLSLTPLQSNSLPIGTLRYTIVQNNNGRETIMFTDRDHGPQSSLEVKYGPIPLLPEPIRIQRGEFTTIDGALRVGAFAGPASLPDATETLTLMITGDHLLGRMVFEASLHETPPSSVNDWFIAEECVFDELTGTVVVNLTGNYSWVRIKLEEIAGSLTDILMK